MTSNASDAGRSTDRQAVAPVPPTTPTAELTRLIQKTAQAAGAIGRNDLVSRLAQTEARLRDPEVRVLVVGEFKQGKSKLINALVTAPVCPVDDDIATSVPTAVAYGDQPSAAILVRSGECADAPIVRQPIDINAIADYVSEQGNPGNERAIVAAEVRLPREILKGGLRLVDSPGVGGPESMRSLSTLSALSTAHAMLLVSDASQEYTEPEVQLIRHALRVSPNVSAVLSKTDIYPHWRQIERIDAHHLDEVGHIPIYPISSDLRLMAAQQQDQELNNESGFPALVAHLRRDVVARAEVVQQRGAVHDMVSVVDQLSLSLTSELKALLNPEQTPAMIAQLERAKANADEFRSRTSRWQVTLTDGIADLIADTEHDLRDRLRRVQREAEAAIDEGDPGPIWDQFTEWLEQRISEAVSESFVWTNDRQQFLAAEVADHFAEGELSIPRIDVGDTDGVLEAVEELAWLDAGSLGAGEKLYIGVRGSYGGVLMMGLATSLIGMSLINPISLLAGVFVGRRAFREDMSARLTRRQNEAKNHVRRYIDEVVFQVGKQLRDRLRMVQRVTRDHFGGIADEIHRSLTEAVANARIAASTYSTDRDKRIQQLRTQLGALEALKAEIPAPAPAPSIEPPPAHLSVEASAHS
ncbi:MAG: dynamin family protein [Nigerium sp.]|nr:dynamin family protein [Nigerium sp.]